MTGRTERAGEVPLRDDPEDKRLDVFPGSDDADRSVTEERGAKPDATAYGDRSFYFPDQRAGAAFDRDLGTAWRVGGDDDPRGERLVVDVARRRPGAGPVRANRLTLVQPHGPDDTRFITKVRLKLGNGRSVDVDLDDSSRTDAGQVIRFPERPIDRLGIEVLETNVGVLPGYGGQNGVGFAEVRLGGARRRGVVDEVVRMPTRLLRTAGASSLSHRLVFLMSRLGYEPASRRRQAEEPSMARDLEVPTARAFAVTGLARVDPNAPDATLDDVLGTTAPGAVFAASGHLRGDAAARASRAFDHDPHTAWVAPMGPLVDQVGQALDVTLDAPITVDGLDLRVVADGRHSVPTRLRLEVDGAPPRLIDVPPIVDGAAGATRSVPVSFAPVTGTHLRLVVDRVRAVTTPDPSTHQPVALPVAIAETGLGGVPVPASPAEIPSACRTDLVTVDGAPLDVRVTGGVTPAEARRGLDLTACDGQPLALAAGRHVVRSARGAATGLDVDRLVLGSDRGGGPLPPGPLGARRITSGARARVTDSGPTHVDARVRTDGRPFWLVLGQSRNDGWELDVDGAHAGPARLVNGYANGWEITPAGAGDLAVHLRWTPQRLVWWGIGASIVGILLCLVLALRRRRGAAEPPVVPEGAVDAAPGLASPLRSGGAAPPTRVVVLAAVGGALVAGVASRPWVGLVVGVALAVALLVPRARALLTVGSVAAFALAAAYVVVQQARHGYPTISSWPSQFEDVADLAWLAVWLLAADVLVQALRRTRSTPTPNRGV